MGKSLNVFPVFGEFPKFAKKPRKTVKLSPQRQGDGNDTQKSAKISTKVCGKKCKNTPFLGFFDHFYPKLAVPPPQKD